MSIRAIVLSNFSSYIILCIIYYFDLELFYVQFLGGSKDEKESWTHPIKSSKYNESFEKVPFITAALTHFGFYILMFLGFINQLLFTPNVAKEQNRKVCTLFDYLYPNYRIFML
jgi:hypothetical protein